MATIAGMTLALSMLGGCGASEDDTYLPALRQDPMASWTPSGADQSSETYLTPYSSGGSLMGKPQQAEVQRVFTLATAADVAAAAREGQSAATAADWEAEAVEGLFNKPIAGGTAHLSVLPNSAEPRELVVVLALMP